MTLKELCQMSSEERTLYMVPRYETWPDNGILCMKRLPSAGEGKDMFGYAQYGVLGHSLNGYIVRAYRTEKPAFELGYLTVADLMEAGWRVD